MLLHHYHQTLAILLSNKNYNNLVKLVSHSYTAACSSLHQSNISGVMIIVLCRATGQPSIKTIAAPCIIAFVFIGVICAMVAIIVTTGGQEGGGVPTIAIALPPILMGSLVILFLIWVYSVSRQVWFVAITPTRVITVRRGGICTNYMISVPLAEIVQIQSNQAPAGICCAPGPFLALNTLASLQV